MKNRIQRAVPFSAPRQPESIILPRSIEELEEYACQLRALPDSAFKLGRVHGLSIYCHSHGKKAFRQAFDDLLGNDIERLKKFWGFQNGKELLAEQIAKNGGAA